MIFDEKSRQEQLQCDIDIEAAKHQHYHHAKLMNMNILQAKKYYIRVRVELLNKLSLLILLSEELWKNEQK